MENLTQHSISRLLILGFAAITALPIEALTLQGTSVTDTTISTANTAHNSHTHTPTLLTQEQASLWQLSPKEWTQYQQLMRGPAGRWYTQLNPPEVLGLLAKDKTQRAHYADLVVQQRKARIDRELAFNRAVHAAWLRHYPRLKPIQTFDARPFEVKKRSGHQKNKQP